MEPDDLKQLLRRMRAATVEWSHLEAKLAEGGVPKNLPETLSALSNTSGGGVVLLGVGQGPVFEVKGISDPSPFTDQLVTMCQQKMCPPVEAQIDTVPVEGERVVVVEVPEAGTSQKPVYIKNRGQYHGAFIRRNDGDHRMTEYEVLKMLENRGQPEHDTAPVKGATREDLDEGKVREFIEGVRERSSGPIADGEDGEIMRASRVLVESDGKLVPSLAGLLMLGKYPQEYFPNLRVVYMQFPNPDPNEPTAAGDRYLDNRSLEGTIPQIIEETLRLLKGAMRTATRITGSPRREDVPEYPEVAIREAVANALLHRDYAPQAQGSQISVSLYPDRLTISNPGGLFGTVTVENLLDPEVQQARNQALMRIAEDRGVVENRGGGIGAMVRALRENNLEPPTFSNSPSRFRVTFHRHHLLDAEAREWLDENAPSELNSNQRLALAYVRNEKTIRNHEYRQLCGVDMTTATRELAEMVEAGALEMCGVAGGAFYVLSQAVGGQPPRTDLRSLPEGSDRLYAYIRSNMPVTRQQMQHDADSLGLSKTQVKYRLERLVEAGLVTGLVDKPRDPRQAYIIAEGDGVKDESE